MSMIWENLQQIEERIATAAQRSGRKREEITLIAVTKTHPAEMMLEAYEAGLRHFGENRVQEWEGKRGSLANLNATWHLIGHLQSNKAARAAIAFHCIDSVDDLALAQRLDRARAERSADRLRVLLEVHLGGEESKSGIEPAQVQALAEKAAALPHLHLAGLMCIPPFCEEPAKARPYFRKLRELRDQAALASRLALPVLSMGMSHDFEVAIEEGATEVRIGTALFGARPKI